MSRPVIFGATLAQCGTDNAAFIFGGSGACCGVAVSCVGRLFCVAPRASTSAGVAELPAPLAPPRVEQPRCPYETSGAQTRGRCVAMATDAHMRALAVPESAEPPRLARSFYDRRPLFRPCRFSGA